MLNLIPGLHCLFDIYNKPGKSLTCSPTSLSVVSSVILSVTTGKSSFSISEEKGELRLSGNHTVTEYEMSGEPYSQKRIDKPFK